MNDEHLPKRALDAHEDIEHGIANRDGDALLKGLIEFTSLKPRHKHRLIDELSDGYAAQAFYSYCVLRDRGEELGRPLTDDELKDLAGRIF